MRPPTPLQNRRSLLTLFASYLLFSQSHCSCVLLCASSHDRQDTGASAFYRTLVMLLISVNDVASYNHSIYTQLAYTISPPNEVRIETSSRSLLLDSSYLPLRTISLILILRPIHLPSNKFYKKFFQHEGLYVTSIASRMSNTSITYDSSPHWIHCRIDWVSL